MGLRGIGADPLSSRGERLSHAQQMFLQYGPAPGWADAFSSEQECRLVWVCNRDDLLAAYPPGRRPIAWWRFEARVAYPGYDREPVVLYESELIGGDERAALEREWRREFERAFTPNFFHCEASRIFNAAAARRMHFRWMGAPRALLASWVRERRRQGKTVRQLVETAAAEPPAA
jgi:hypothetical protein